MNNTLILKILILIAFISISLNAYLYFYIDDLVFKQEVQKHYIKVDYEECLQSRLLALDKKYFNIDYIFNNVFRNCRGAE